MPNSVWIQIMWKGCVAYKNTKLKLNSLQARILIKEDISVENDN